MCPQNLKKNTYSWALGIRLNQWQRIYCTNVSVSSVFAWFLFITLVIFFICSSDDGTVNIYDQSCLLQPKNQTGYDLARPEPIKKVFNLTQRCTQMSFNHSNEILAISSNMTEESAVKLVRQVVYYIAANCRLNLLFYFFNTIFVSSHMYPENLEGTQVIVGSMNMGYISDNARNRTHNLFRPKREPIPLDQSDKLHILV